ncbi:MAG TPA: hypothetical protein VJ725_28535, partial [Thermoanaerobaculia bacterium]|nr:hypothetical protein [Thermoanaerobaculia bacterium]
RSYARAVLYTNNGTRIYTGQIILGHQVLDLTIGLSVYSSRIVTEIGYANSSTGNAVGNYDSCYYAEMAAHANAYSLHEFLNRSWVCMPSEPEEIPHIEDPDENCPVLLDLEQDGFHLSGTNPAVNFDIDADGAVDRIAWTKAGEDDAFLCLDRNHNGKIDDGSELFGYATPLSSGNHAKVGYRALAEFDRLDLGGNSDGKIDSEDLVFDGLCAWIDEDRDGVSQSHEIHPLDQVGVVALRYQYRRIRLLDLYGNLFRYVSSVEMKRPSGVVDQWPTYDVIFAEP